MCEVFSVTRPHLHVVHGLSCPLARLSSRLTEVCWGVLFVLLSHSLHLMTLGGGGVCIFHRVYEAVSRFQASLLGFARAKSVLRLFLVWHFLL